MVRANVSALLALGWFSVSIGSGLVDLEEVGRMFKHMKHACYLHKIRSNQQRSITNGTTYDT